MDGKIYNIEFKLKKIIKTKTNSRYLQQKYEVLILFRILCVKRIH